MILARLGAVLALLLVLGSPVAGQTAEVDPASSPIVAELEGIRYALDRLVALQEAGQRERQVDLLIKRLALQQRQLDSLEGRLQSTESEIRKQEDTLRALEGDHEQSKNQLRAEIKTGDESRGETQIRVEEIERAQTASEERLDAAHLRLRQLQDEIAEEREGFEALDKTLTDLLERNPED